MGCIRESNNNKLQDYNLRNKQKSCPKESRPLHSKSYKMQLAQ